MSSDNRVVSDSAKIGIILGISKYYGIFLGRLVVKLTVGTGTSLVEMVEGIGLMEDDV